MQSLTQKSGGAVPRVFVPVRNLTKMATKKTPIANELQLAVATRYALFLAKFVLRMPGETVISRLPVAILTTERSEPN